MLKLNKKGDIVSIIYVVLIAVIIGILFLFFNRLTDPMYDHLEVYFNDSDNIEALEATQTIHATDNTAWDWGFLGLIIGMLISLALTAFATRISVAFYWIYGLMSIIVLVLGVAMSNVWQQLAEDPAFASSISHYPITNAILGSNYPIFIAAIIFVGMIILFGKTKDQGGLQ